MSVELLTKETQTYSVKKEIFTGKYWEDENGTQHKIYRKCFHISSITGNEVKIELSGITTMLTIHGGGYNRYNNFFDLSSGDQTLQRGLYYELDHNNTILCIVSIINGQFATCNVNIICEYIKD